MKKHMKTIMKKIQTGVQWSRYCLRSLFVTFLLVLTFGIGQAWALGNSVPTYNGSTWYSLYDATKYDNDNNTTKTRNLNFDVVPPTSGTIYLDWRKNDHWPGADIYVNDTKIAYVNAMSNSHKSFETVNTSLGEDATTVKIGIHGSSKYSAEVESLKVAMKPHIRLYNEDAVGVTSKTDTVANTVYGSTSATAYRIRLRSFLMQNANLSYHSSNSEFHFGNDKVGRTDTTIAVLANSCAFRGVSDATKANCTLVSNALGKAEDYEVDVYFTPSANVNAQRNCTITIKDGNVERATVILTAKVIPTYYFKATSVATDGTGTLDIPVRASFSEGVYSGSTLTISQTAATADVASLTKRAYFYAPASSGDYQFQGWYTNAACTSDRVSTDNTIYYDITSSGLTSGTAVEKKYYAKYLESITAEFENEGSHDLEVGDAYESISYSRTSSATATDDDEDEENFFWYEIVDNTPAGITTGSDNADKIISYNPSTKVVTAHNAGTATLRLHQRAHGLYEAVDAEYEFTVSKKTNALKCAWNNGSAGDDWDENMNFDSKMPVKFSSTNTSGPAISVTQSPASAVATFKAGAGGANPDTIITNFREGTVTWTVSQAEDYMYVGDEVTCSVIVGTVPSPGCTIKLYDGDNTERKCSEFGDNRAVWSPAGKAVMLYFEAERTTLLSKSITPYEYVNGEWVTHDGWAVGGSLERNYNTFDRNLSANATAVKFSASNDDDVRVRKVYVTGVSYFNIDTIGGGAITKLNMPVNTKGGNVTRAKFCVDYGTCADNIKLASDHPRIKFAASNSTTHSFSTGTNHHGRDTIELTYTSPVDEGEDITATITIYTPYEHKTLTVNAETKVLSTILEYKGASSYAVDHANMLATDLFQVRDENGDLVASPTITLISNATGVINTISSNTAIDFICGGSATITASFAGVANMYEAASDLGQTITVNKLSDAISWSGVGDDGKIHVWADTDIPTSIASANSDIASYSVASANPYLSVTKEEEVYTLHAGIVGEVALTATSAGDCTYATASGSKTIAVDPREHAIIWDQDLEGIQTDDRGYIINRRITLNAYAVDNESNPTNVPVSYEITGGGTFATIENGNELVINVANLSGTLSTTITATTTVGTKYAIVSETKTISVVRWGTNTAKSADNTSDIVDGKIVINAPHATFTFSGATDITEFGYATVLGKPEGYKLAQSLDKNGGSKTYNFSWVSTNANCSIQVNKISFWIKAYDSDAFVSNKAKVSFDGAAEVSVGTAAMTANDGDFKHFSKPENYTNRNVPVVCRVTGYENFDFYIKNISIEYTVYTTAPSATEDIEQVDRTINTSDKQTVDVRSLFSYATPAPSDFEYSYEIVGAPEHAFLEGGYLFWADAVGDYTVRAKVNMDEDHRESEWGSEKTIRVNKVPYVFNNSEEDQEWDTKNNWTISSWPIENLPTEDDDVIVRGHLTIDEEIVINSMTIDAGEGYIVEIAPTGGLTVGSGGVIGATKDNLKLKAGTSGVEKGQTGYLRISPDYAGAMPEATVELFSVSYYDQAAGADNSAVWQGVGSPISETGVLAKSVYTSCWVYSWDETTDGWVNNRATLKLTPFVGFSTTQKKEPEGRKYTYEGHLVSGAAPVTMDLAYTEGHGTNLLANSWAAPISIPNFESSDFVNAAQTIYILNAGTKAQSDANEGGFTAPGKYIGVPIQTASELAASGYPVVIPSMQGFWVQAEGASAKLRLDYSRLVWGADYSGDGSNQPLRAPKHNAEASPVTGKMKVSISAGGWSDFIFLLESEKYLPEYEDGYDAIKIPSGGMDLFTVEGENYLGVDATNSIIGTRVGVRTSEETAYTMTFSHLKSESDMSLWDLEADQKIEINEGTTYTFFAEPNAEITDRFLIIERAGASTNTTGVDDAEDEANVHKFIKDNQLYILKNGVLYNGTGARVK